MPSIKIQYDGDDKTLERLTSLASEAGVTVEELVKRSIAQHLDGYGLKQPTGTQMQGVNSVTELFPAWGITKK